MATELAQAYVQIIPSAQGIQGKLQSALDPQMESAGMSAGKKLSAGMKAVAVAGAAAIGVALTKGIKEGAALEQSVGGIETMFKDSSDKMIKYANEAYKTAGMSANTYMEQATSFSASLLQSVGGNTEKAADLANQALIDMSDNSNKFGTDMERITDAFQGFSKQNYTMLDNLKLGYGGTKTEMERLLKDAQEISGIEYNIDNLSDVYSAIHVIQKEMGVTGTTAKEAGETFSGSLNQMKGALDNLLGTLALGDQATMSLKDAVSGLVQSAIAFIGNAVPMIGNFLMSLPPVLFELLSSVNFTEIQNFVSTAFTSLVNFITGYLPTMVVTGLKTVSSFIVGLIESIPALLKSATTLVQNLDKGMQGKFGLILEAGKKAVIKIARGIISNLPQIITTAARLVGTLAKTIISNLPQILRTGAKILASLVKGIASALGGVVKDMLSIGKDLVRGIWNGISGSLTWIKNKIKGWVGNVTDFLKSVFGIHSPSKLMRDEVGVFLARGIGVGFEDEMGDVEKNMAKAIPSSFNVAPTIGYNTRHSSSFTGGMVIHNITTLDGKVIAEETFPYTDRMMSKKLSYGGIL